MNYELWLAFRYLTTRNKERFISIISLISILGVAIGVMALIIVLAVMTGFDNDLKDKIIGTNSHILVEQEGGMQDYPAVIKELQNIKGISAASGYINGRVFIQYDDYPLDLIIRGIDPEQESKVTKIKEYLAEGSLADLKGDTVIIGKGLADYLSLSVGEEVNFAVAFSKKMYRFKIVGIFSSGMYDYDMNLVFIPLDTAQNIFKLPNLVGGIAVKLDNIYQANLIRSRIQERLGFQYSVRTWMQTNRNFFAALQLEKITMFIILTLIVLVASFNIFSTLTVIVTRKVKDIGILKSIGVSSRSIKKIFTFQGLSIGLIGTSLGLISGLIICILLKKYQFIKLPQDIYYIQYLPVYIQWQDIFVVALAAVLISFLSTLYPASKAAKLDPVEALRYE